MKLRLIKDSCFEQFMFLKCYEFTFIVMIHFKNEISVMHTGFYCIFLKFFACKLDGLFGILA